MELSDVQSGDAEIREAFHAVTRKLVDHLIAQNMMSNFNFLDRLRVLTTSCQREGMNYHETCINAALMKGFSDEEKAKIKSDLKELLAEREKAKKPRKKGGGVAKSNP